MRFAIRKRSAEITLGVGQSKRYLLIAGVIHIAVFAVFRPDEAEPPDDGTGTPPLAGLMPDEADAKEDFHGAIAYASALTGRGLV